MLRTSESLLILVLYVYDLLTIGSSTKTIVLVKDILHDRFSMMDMGPLHYFIGLEISQDASTIDLSHTRYAQYLLVRFYITYCNSTSTPLFSGVHLKDGVDTSGVDITLYQKLVGILLYLTHTQSDLSYVIGVVSRNMQEFHELH